MKNKELTAAIELLNSENRVLSLCFTKEWFDICPINELKYLSFSSIYKAIRMYHCVNLIDIDEKELAALKVLCRQVIKEANNPTLMTRLYCFLFR